MNHSTTAGATAIDPICGMTIDPATAAGSSSYDGHTYHFCSRNCKTKFDGAPAEYAGAAATAAAATSGCPPGHCHC
jgi:Cu+-exporting ATPase